MQTTWEDIEEHESGLGFNNLSFEDFRQDLLEELQRDEEFYRKMPKRVYTGFNKNTDLCSTDGIIALLGFPSKPPKAVDHEYRTYDLKYIDKQGKQVLLNQKEVLEDGTVKKRAGSETKDILAKLKTGDSKAVNRVKDNISVSDK
ncbi:MAG: hypothetical protein GF401_11660 [Chitinivibrionales bacterium]|nr:hypothetical protein [Chitinivibrionales bacterium]